MNKDVKKYLDDISLWKSLPKVMGTPTIKCDEIRPTNKFVEGVRIIRFGGCDYYLKEVGNKKCRIVEMASGEMYNDLGMNTPHLHFLTDVSMKMKDRTLHKLKGYECRFFTATKDAINIPGYECKLAREVLNDFQFKYRFQKKYSPIYEFKWSMLTDEDIKNDLLSIMTKKCFDDFVNMFLLDEVRMDIDRHSANFIFYKKIGADKYEGIVPIDLEQVAPFVLMANDDFALDKKSNFEFIIKHLQYYSQTPIDYHEDYLTYADRLADIIELIHQGDLSNNSINILKKEISYDFPEKIKEVGKCSYLEKFGDDVYDLYARLWEYNRNTLGKEIGL